MKVPFLDVAATYHTLRSELDGAIQAVLDRGWFVLGEEVEGFEREFAAFCGTRHAIGVGTGLDALVLALRAAGIGPGDEVVVPGNTFVATWLAVTAVGATPVGAEPLEATANLDPSSVAACLSSRTRAIVPVHLYGQPADLTALRALADRHGLFLLEDAAQAHGATWRGQPAGSLGHAAAFSFYPGKNLGAFGDGGAVTTDDPALADRIRKLRNYGSSVKYQHDIPGTNSRLDELQAAVLRVKLRHLPAWTERRRALAARYQSALAEVPGITLPVVHPDAQPVWHLFVVQHDDRDGLATALREQGVATQVHYPVPCHRTGAYAELDHRPLPVTERLAQRVLSLPMGPHVTEAQATHVIRAVDAAQAGPLLA